VTQAEPRGHVGRQATEAVDHRVIDRLQGGKTIPDLGHVRPRLGGVVVHHLRGQQPPGLSSRSTRLPLTRTPCSRWSRARTVR